MLLITFKSQKYILTLELEINSILGFNDFLKLLLLLSLLNFE